MKKKLDTIDIKDINNLSKSETLRLIFSYSNFIDDDAFESLKDADEIFKYMIDLYGFNKLPKVLSDKDFDKLSSETFFRGVQDISHMANFLCDPNYHYGTGYINGTFASTKKNIAENYTNILNRFQPISINEHIMTFKLINPKICLENDLKFYFNVLCFETFPKTVWAMSDFLKGKLAHYEKSTYKQDKNTGEWINAIIKFMKTIKTQEEQKWFLAKLEIDISKFAVLLGYDAIKTENETIIIFNRGKVAVSKSELERVTKDSQIYNSDQTVNFENQPQ